MSCTTTSKAEGLLSVAVDEAGVGLLLKKRAEIAGRAAAAREEEATALTRGRCFRSSLKVEFIVFFMQKAKV